MDRGNHSRTRPVAVLMVAALLGLAALSPAAASPGAAAKPSASTTGASALALAPSSTPQPVDQATCAGIIATLKAGAMQLSSAQQAVLPSLKPTDCVWVESGSVTPSVPTNANATDGTAVIAATTACSIFDKSYSLGIVGIPVMTMRVRVNMCWNGSTAWADWGPNCYFPSFPLWGTRITWCGVYHNGYWEKNPGMNGEIFPIVTPFWTVAYPWMRYRVYGNGSSSSPWGGAGN